MGLMSPMGPMSLMGQMSPMGLMSPMGPMSLMGQMSPMGLMSLMGQMSPMGPRGQLGLTSPMGLMSPMGLTSAVMSPLSGGGELAFPLICFFEMDWSLSPPVVHPYMFCSRIYVDNSYAPI